MIECACVICHGPIEVKQKGISAIVCGENCHGIWRRYKHTGRLAAKYQAIRAAHAYRRSLEVALLAVESRVRMVAV